jgi:hypothetical protein
MSLSDLKFSKREPIFQELTLNVHARNLKQQFSCVLCYIYIYIYICLCHHQIPKSGIVYIEWLLPTTAINLG